MTILKRNIDEQLDQLRHDVTSWSGLQENVQARRDLRASCLALAASLSTPEDLFADAFYQVAMPSLTTIRDS
jgi:hypothetical protein